MNANHRFDRAYVINPISGCWEWCMCRDKDGYGRFALAHDEIVLAHRFSHERYKGPLRDLFALHSCDNPPCVNPDHLFKGTALDNCQDMLAKGRHVAHHQGPTGERSRTAKLTAADILLIRSNPKSAADLAVEYGVTPRSIYMILARETWKHI